MATLPPLPQLSPQLQQAAPQQYAPQPEYQQPQIPQLPQQGGLEMQQQFAAQNPPPPIPQLPQQQYAPQPQQALPPQYPTAPTPQQALPPQLPQAAPAPVTQGPSTAKMSVPDLRKFVKDIADPNHILHLINEENQFHGGRKSSLGVLQKRLDELNGVETTPETTAAASSESSGDATFSINGLTLEQLLAIQNSGLI